MTEGVADAAQAPATAGGLLRQARQARGLHIAALAATIKVTQRKLELLESDQIDALPDATFARALAQTVCRALKIDPAPVLALLPPPSGYRIEQLGEGLNTPYSDTGGMVPRDWSGLANSTLWVAALLVAAAAAMYLMPADWIARVQAVVSPEAPSVAPPASTPVAPTEPAIAAAEPAVAVAGPTVTAEAAAPAASVLAGVARVEAAASAAAVPAVAIASPVMPVVPAVPVVSGASAGLLQLRTSAPSWIEVRDAQGKVMLSRVVAADETLTLDGVAPLKLTIGNAAATRLEFRGEAVDLAASTRDNVARLELK